jgi:hypothetical protein
MYFTSFTTLLQLKWVEKVESRIGIVKDTLHLSTDNRS